MGIAIKMKSVAEYHGMCGKQKRNCYIVNIVDTPDYLLLAAFAPELAGLDSDPPRGWRAVLTGIGAITAAATTARILCEMRPKAVLFIGTCGAYGERLNVGDCIAASEVIAVSVSEIQRRAFRPSLETTRWSASWELPLPKHAVAVPPAITSSSEDTALLGQIADVEHLELAGVFAACHLVDVPVTAALTVANRVGPNAHAEWRANHECVSRRLVELLGRFEFDVI
jgi:purine-nucleoside phosphorylase